MVESNEAAASGSNTQEVYAESSTKETFTIEQAQALTEPTPRILCTLADNTYIRFGEYSVVDYDTRTQLLHVTSEKNK